MIAFKTLLPVSKSDHFTRRKRCFSDKSQRSRLTSRIWLVLAQILAQGHARLRLRLILAAKFQTFYVPKNHPTARPRSSGLFTHTPDLFEHARARFRLISNADHYFVRIMHAWNPEITGLLEASGYPISFATAEILLGGFTSFRPLFSVRPTGLS